MPLFLITLTLCFVMAGCSFNEIGFVKKDVVHANGATVEKLAAPGLHISRQPSGMGVTIGYAQSISVFSTECKTQRAIPELTFRRFFGFSITLQDSEISGTIGIRENLNPRRVGIGEDVLRRIHFEPGNLDATVIELERSDCVGG